MPSDRDRCVQQLENAATTDEERRVVKWLKSAASASLPVVSFTAAHAVFTQQNTDVFISEADYVAFVRSGSAGPSNSSGPAKLPVLPPMRKMTKNKKAMLSKMGAVSAADAMADLDAKVAAKQKTTKTTYNSEVGGYELFCSERKWAPYPLEEDRVYEFLAYAGAWNCFDSMYTALQDANKARGFPKLESERCELAVAALQDDADGEEPSEPIPKDYVKACLENASGDAEERCALQMAGSWFGLFRCGAFRHLRANHIQPSTDDGSTGDPPVVAVTMTHLKGRAKHYNVKFEAEALRGPGVEYVTFMGAQIPFCPYSIFTLIRARLQTRPGQPLFGSATETQEGYNTKLNDTIEALLQKQGVETREDGRKRRLYTSHGLRSGGVCTLLKAGLERTVIENLADWKSDMIEHYGRKVCLQPRRTQAYAFYNPIELRGRYGDSKAAAGMNGQEPGRPSKRQRTK